MSNQKRRLSFVQLDVFTAIPLEGNQLAVFTDARGLSDFEMQALAREMNLSETTFIMPRDEATERERGVRVRIFTTTEELPFAGHPTLGTAMVLRGSTGAATVNLDLNVGKIPVQFTMRDGLAFGEMMQREPRLFLDTTMAFASRNSGRSTRARTWRALRESPLPLSPMMFLSRRSAPAMRLRSYLSNRWRRCRSWRLHGL